MRVFSSVCAAVLTASLLMGCGKLSKDKAKEMIQAKHFADPSASCTLKGFPQVSGSGASEEWTITAPGTTAPEVSKFSKCIDELSKQNVLESSSCVDTVSSGCWKYKFTLGPKGRLKKLANTAGELSFACGSRKLLEVTSVRTEDKKAVVKFKRDATLDDTSKSVSHCTVELPEAGLAEREVTFLKDDDGNWTLPLAPTSSGWAG